VSLRARPLWFEGQLVRPQHLQQLQRWLEAMIEDRIGGISPFSWGVAALELDGSLLPLGKIGIESCRAILPDGVPIDIPAKDDRPAPITVPAETANRVVKLAIPARAADELEVGTAAARFRLKQQPARNTTGESQPAQIAIGVPTLRLILDGDPEDELVCLPLLRIDRVDPTGRVLIDASFVPPSVRLGAHPGFVAFAREIEGMLSGHGNSLSRRVDPARAGFGVATMVDFTLLQLINSHEPVFASLARSAELGPHALYHEALRLAGALATFSRTGRRPPPLPDWRHDDPGPCLAAIAEVIRDLISQLSTDTAISLPLQPRGQGVWVSPITDRPLLSGATFVLVVSASVDPEQLRSSLPAQAKIGPAETIRDLVNLQLPGIALRPMPVAPREIPYRSGSVYFELDRTSDLWRQLQQSPAFVLHIGSEFPGLVIEFWAIRLG